MLLIIIPTLTSVVLGGTYIATAAQQALSFQRVETLAKLSSDITVLAAHLEDERDETMKYIGLGQVHKGGRGDILTPQQLLTATPAATQSSNLAKAELQLVQQLQGRTDPWIRKVRADSANIGAGYPPQVQEQAQQLGTVLSKIPQLRTAATTSRIGAVDVMTAYISDINSLLTIDNGVALGSGDAALNNDVRSLNLVSLIAEETSEQRGLLVFEFAVDKNFDQKGLSAMQTAVAEQAANLAEFNRVATADQVALFNRQLHNPAVGTASTQEQQAINKGISNQALNEDPTTANDWFGQMTIGS
ncbi:MAG: nitrate- and nitrite sensing domain-containing protein, partial [Actinobacteria bacterium]|nr:nitrate- and nitrite sensing domain-containing protein [Actinomycetota bacterium]